jgi:signal transduction histidine kinase
LNPITAFFIDNITLVFFFYGLAFFVMGVALAVASRQESEMVFVRAILPLALFGVLHGAHEWLEMFQQIGFEQNGRVPGAAEEALRVVILVSSFVMLLLFGSTLLVETTKITWPKRAPALLFVVWLLSVTVLGVALRPGVQEGIVYADVLARYILAIPAAILGAWALMAQQRTFRDHNMPQFGRDLVWAAAALLLYGVIGQIFVRKSGLPPSTVVNGQLFLEWFGIPVQLFRGVMAAMLMIFMVRALRAFEVETRRRLERANRTELQAQQRALEAERSISQERERLNRELQARATELALLLDLSNSLAAPVDQSERLQRALNETVRKLTFSDAGLLLLLDPGEEDAHVAASTGFATSDPTARGARFGLSVELGRHCIAVEKAVCRHADGALIEFNLDAVLIGEECWGYASPTTIIALPLVSHPSVIGTVVFARSKREQQPIGLDELQLMAGIAQQMALSIDNARLYQEARSREQTLQHLFYQIVDAQEAERQRIARELHDATGQSLTAIALGLRGVANAAASQTPALSTQVDSIQGFAQDALGELRRIISDLRPPQLDDLGLLAALRWYVQAFNERNSGIQTTLTVAGDLVRLASHYETVIFRIVQEALTNVARHANATRASVVLESRAHELIVTIQDNGRGFDPSQVLARKGQTTSWGLLGIRERTLLLGGQYEIKSAVGQGTLIRMRAPILRQGADDNSGSTGTNTHVDNSPTAG